MTPPMLDRAALSDCSIVSAGLNAIPGLDEVAGPGVWTLLAPTDAAFASLSIEAIDSLLHGPLPLTAFLRTHLVRGIAAADVLPRIGWLVTAQGDRLPIDVFGDVVLIDGARVISADIPMPFGIAHVIDRVLLSDRGECLPKRATAPPSRERR